MILITSHIGLDFDGFASCYLLTKLYDNSKILLPGALEGKLKKFISLNPQLNEKLIFSLESAKIEKLIIADTSSKSRLPHISELLESFDFNKICLYDHHLIDENSIKCGENYLSKAGATTSLIIIKLIEKNIELTSFEASLGLLGIYEDTNFLAYPGTTSIDLKAASYLMENNGDLQIVNNILKTGLSKKQLDILNKVVSNLERFNIKGRDVAVSTFTSDSYENDISSILHKVVELENLKLLFCIFQLENKTYLICKNNYKDINLKKLIGTKLKGGGHSFVYSASFKKKTIFEIKKIVDGIIADIPSLLNAKLIARPAVYKLNKNDTVKMAFNIMNRLRINSLAILNDDNIVEGVVLRQDVDYSMSHNLQDMPLKEIMNIEFTFVDEYTDIEELRDLFLNTNMKIIFVNLKNNELGIITRTEVFKKALISNSNVVKKVSYKQRLKKVLPEKYNKIFDDVSNTAEELNTEVFIVGGFVRDLILRKKNLDFDFVVTHDGIKFGKKLSVKLGAKCVTHEKFNTCLLILKDGTRLDFATSRLEYYKSPGALPTVEKGHLYHDLYRRDFSINAMAISLNKETFGQLIDYFGGKKDLKEKNIRVLHSLSFIDDPTRLIRAIRFKNRFKFKIGKTTESLMKAACSNKVYKNISGFRFLKEISILFSEENASTVLGDLEKFKVFHFVNEEINIDSYVKDLALKVDSVISWHKLLFKESSTVYWIIYLFTIFIHFKNDELKKAAKLLNLNKKFTSLLLKNKKTIRFLELFFNNLNFNKYLDSEIYMNLKGIETELLLFAVAYFDNEENKKIISKYITYLSEFKLKVTGQDLIEKGFKKGPEIKIILDKVIVASIDEKAFDRKSQLKILKNILEG